MTVKYKEYTNKRREELQFQVGDLVMVDMKMEWIPKEKFTKLVKIKVGPCKILRKCGNNAYEVDLPLRIGISPIFNVSNLFPYKGPVDDDVFASVPSSHATTQPVAPSPPLQIECILDKRVSKKTRRATYFEYLVK